nr:hypothetical protein [Tanacetum cinerariifolium]
WTLEEGKKCCVMSKAAEGGRGKRKVSLSLEGLVMLTLRENGACRRLKWCYYQYNPNWVVSVGAFIERASDLGFPKKIPFIGALFMRTIHRPTTLGEAFSLARIAEARYKDERPTIAIAKPNDLTARVQVQDLTQTTQGRGYGPNRIMLVMIHRMLLPYKFCIKSSIIMGVSRKSSSLETLEEGKRCCIISKAAEGGRGKRVLATAAEDGTMLFLEPQYSPFSILVSVLLLIEEYGIPESRFCFRQHLEYKVVSNEWGVLCP